MSDTTINDLSPSYPPSATPPPRDINWYIQLSSQLVVHCLLSVKSSSLVLYTVAQATLYIELSVKVFSFNSLVFAVIEKTSTVQ